MYLFAQPHWKQAATLGVAFLLACGGQPAQAATRGTGTIGGGVLDPGPATPPEMRPLGWGRTPSVRWGIARPSISTFRRLSPAAPSPSLRAAVTRWWSESTTRSGPGVRTTAVNSATAASTP